MFGLPKSNRIAWKLIKALILFSSLITLITTALQLWFEYDRDVGAIEARFEQVQRSYLNSIGENVWEADIGRLQLLLDGIVEFPDFTYAHVRDEAGRIIASVGESREQSIIEQTYALSHTYHGTPVDIGELHVVASLEGVYDRILKRVGIILVSNGVKTLLVAVFMFVLVYWLLTRHLTALSEFSEHIDISQEPKLFRLDRGAFGNTHDELDQLVEKFNDMQLKLNDVFQSLNESERQKRHILQTVPDLMWLKDLDGVYLACNPKFEDFFGAREHEIIGKTDYDFVDRETADFFRKHDELALNAGHSLSNEEWITFANDGHRALVETVKTPMFDKDGKIKGVLGIARDITKRKEAEDALLKAKDEADKANKTKSEFLASMSHELRTPLNAILGFAQMLELDQNSPLTEKQGSYVKYIVDGGVHLLQLINDILDLARVEANQVQLFLEDVHVSEITLECIKLTKGLAKGRAVIIDEQCCSGFKHDDLIKTDRQRFKQVMLNLISNAIKFNREHGTVSICGEDLQNGYYRITVSDTGYGIREADIDNVFKMFNRLDADAMVAQEGTGIGLTVSRMLVERMGGCIGVESHFGKGSTFWVDLPLSTNTDVLIWTDSLRVGVDAIDGDHQALIMLFNRVTHYSGDIDELGKIVKELVNYTLYHFEREEAVMEACDYPDIESHRDVHKQIAEKISQMSHEWKATQSQDLALELQRFLRHWLADHIMQYDVAIAPYAMGNEIKIRQRILELG